MKTVWAARILRPTRFPGGKLQLPVRACARELVMGAVPHRRGGLQNLAGVSECGVPGVQASTNW